MQPALTFEIVATIYFGVLALAAGAVDGPVRRRFRVALLAFACALAVINARELLALDARFWLGHAYIAAGYWIPALLVGRPTAYATSFESWLIRTEARWGKPGMHRSAPAVFESAYLLCYPLVPAAFLVVWAYGTPADVDRFWTAVLIAAFLCYGTLPWLVSRPPRALEATAPSPVGRANAYVLARVSHGLNTFPSGHVAVSVAASMQVFNVSSAAGLLFGAIAIAVAVGAVAGRYHFTVDALIGLVLGAGTGLL